MLRYVLAAALGFAALGVSQMTVTADDKKDTKATKLEGKLVCTKGDRKSTRLNSSHSS